MGVGASKSSRIPPEELRFPSTPIKCQITFLACVFAAHVAYLFQSYREFVKLFIFLNKIVQFKETLIPQFFVLSRAMTPLSLPWTPNLHAEEMNRINIQLEVVMELRVALELE